jgi:hypothetical protein
VNDRISALEGRVASVLHPTLLGELGVVAALAGALLAAAPICKIDQLFKHGRIIGDHRLCLSWRRYLACRLRYLGQRARRF